MEDNGLDLGHTLAMLWHRRLVVVSSIVVTTFAAVLLSTSQPNTYTASARVLIRPIAIEDTDGGLTAALDPAMDTSIDTQATIIASGEVAGRASRNLRSIDPSSYSLEATPITDNIVQVQVASADPQATATVANAYVDAYLSLRGEVVQQTFEQLAENLDGRIQDLNERILEISSDLESSGPSSTGLTDRSISAERDDLISAVGALNARKVEYEASAERVLAGGGGQVVQEATPPSAPSEPNTIRDAQIGFLLGAILGVASCFLAEHLNRRVYTPEDAERAARAPVLSTVRAKQRRILSGRRGGPPVRGSAARRSGGSDDDEGSYEAARELRAALKARGLGTDFHRLLIASAEDRQGAPSATLSLGRAYAAAGVPTVIVAADLRNGHVDRLCGSSDEPGLTDILASNGPVPHAVWKVLFETPTPNLSVLPAGVADASARDLLASPRLSLVIKELARSTGVVLVAAPPLDAGADAAMLAGHTDAAVLAVRTGTASSSALGNASESLKDLGVPLLGLELNSFDEGPSVPRRSQKAKRRVPPPRNQREPIGTAGAAVRAEDMTSRDQRLEEREEDSEAGREPAVPLAVSDGPGSPDRAQLANRIRERRPN